MRWAVLIVLLAGCDDLRDRHARNHMEEGRAYNMTEQIELWKKCGKLCGDRAALLPQGAWAVRCSCIPAGASVGCTP